MDSRLAKFDEYLSDPRRCSTGTRKLYIDDLSNWLETIGSNKPTQANAQAYLNTLTRLKPNTIAIIGHAMMRYFKFNGIVVELETPKIFQPDPQYLSLDEFSKAIETCSSQLETTMLIVLFDSGVRIKELINLKLSDINYAAKTITVTRKGGKVDVVNVSDKALNELSNWIETRGIDSEKVFGELRYYDAWQVFKRIGARIGRKELHPHMLRHSRAIQMLIAGAPMHVVQQHLGHKNESMTSAIYAKFTVSDLRKQIPDCGSKDVSS